MILARQLQTALPKVTAQTELTDSGTPGQGLGYLCCCIYYKEVTIMDSIKYQPAEVYIYTCISPPQMQHRGGCLGSSGGGFVVEQLADGCAGNRSRDDK